MRDRLRRHLERHESVHLLVSGKPKWGELLDHLAKTLPAPELHQVDLDQGGMEKRHNLLSEMLGRTAGTITPADDLLKFHQTVTQQPSKSRVVLRHFDRVQSRPDAYGIDLFSVWRHLMGETRKLVLLFQSRSPLLDLIPQELQESPVFTSLETVELKGRAHGQTSV